MKSCRYSGTPTSCRVGRRGSSKSHFLVLLRAIAIFHTVIGTAFEPLPVSDWKFYGEGVEDGVKIDGFYLNSGIVRLPHDMIQIWIEDLPEKDVSEKKKNPSPEFLETVTSKFRAGYQPPMATVVKLSDSELINIVVTESVADLENITPSFRALFEIDCNAMTYRTLSIHMVLNGKPESTDIASESKHIPPQSNISRLMRFVCPPGS